MNADLQQVLDGLYDALVYRSALQQQAAPDHIELGAASAAVDRAATEFVNLFVRTDVDAPKKSSRAAAPSGLKNVGFYRITDLAGPNGLIGFGRSTLYDMAKRGDFPAPTHPSAGVSAWPVPVINAWLRKHKAIP